MCSREIARDTLTAALGCAALAFTLLPIIILALSNSDPSRATAFASPGPATRAT